ncbi:MAG: hypothetical protein AAF502_16020 [Bacteroidota bacterium]
MNSHLSFNVELAFEQLFSIGIEHDYYSSGIADDLIIKPSVISEMRMRKLDLQQKSGRMGAIVGFKVGSNAGDFFLKQEEPIGFSFMVYCDNPAFSRFTRMPFPKEGTGFYFSNTGTNVVEGRPMLMVNEFAGEADLVPFMPPYFEYSMGQAPEMINARVLDIFGNIVAEEEILSGGRAAYKVDLRDMMSGKYILQIEGEPDFEFYRLDANERQPFAVIDIYFDRNGNPDQSLLNGDGLVEREYIIRFEPRSTIWKYCIFNKTNANLFQNHQITDPSKKFKFSGPEEQLTNSGRNILSISSSEAIQLEENPNHQFQLKVQRATGSNTEVVIDLPNANPLMMVSDPDENNETYYSKINIYV